MDWIQAGTFFVQETQQNIPVIELFLNLEKPKGIVLIYNPKEEHALLFRDEEEGIILDYLDRKAIELFNQASEVAICEMDEDGKNVHYFYRVPLKAVDDSLNIKLIKTTGV